MKCIYSNNLSDLYQPPQRYDLVYFVETLLTEGKEQSKIIYF